jgi:hypothetical protein
MSTLHEQFTATLRKGQNKGAWRFGQVADQAVLVGGDNTETADRHQGQGAGVTVGQEAVDASPEASLTVSASGELRRPVPLDAGRPVPLDAGRTVLAATLERRGSAQKAAGVGAQRGWVMLFEARYFGTDAARGNARDPV